MTRILWVWHQFWGKYNLQLYLDCLDDKMKEKLMQRIEYHDNKLRS